MSDIYRGPMLPGLPDDDKGARDLQIQNLHAQQKLKDARMALWKKDDQKLPIERQDIITYVECRLALDMVDLQLDLDPDSAIEQLKGRIEMYNKNVGMSAKELRQAEALFSSLEGLQALKSSGQLSSRLENMIKTDIQDHRENAIMNSSIIADLENQLSELLVTMDPQEAARARSILLDPETYSAGGEPTQEIIVEISREIGINEAELNLHIGLARSLQQGLDLFKPPESN